MNRYLKFVASGALALLSASPALAQQAKSPPPPPQTPTPFQGGTAKAQTPQAPAQNYGGINKSPWYGDKTVQQQLRFNANQYNMLNKAHDEAYAKYNANIGQLGNGLTEQQRAQKMQELQANYQQNVNKSLDTMIPDAAQRQRYDQLQLQYQGYGAVNNPAMQQKLGLTKEQSEQMSNFGKEWNKQMALHHQNYQSDPAGTTKLYNDLNNKTNEQFYSVLNDQQKQMWRQMTGEPYNFPPSVYFQGNGGSGK